MQTAGRLNTAVGEGTETMSGYRIRWDKLAMEVRRRARALVEDPECQESLRRRLGDGKAPRMMRLLLEWPDKKSRDPDELRRGTPPLTYMLPFHLGEYDPLAEQEKVMIAAQEAQEEQEAHERREARNKLSAATAASPEEPPGSNDLQLVRDI